MPVGAVWFPVVADLDYRPRWDASEIPDAAGPAHRRQMLVLDRPRSARQFAQPATMVNRRPLVRKAGPRQRLTSSRAQLYVTLAEALAALVSVPHGLSAMASDYYEVDRDQFATFIAALEAWSPGDHMVAHALLDGFLMTSLVLLGRMSATPELDAQTTAAVAALAPAMGV